MRCSEREFAGHPAGTRAHLCDRRYRAIANWQHRGGTARSSPGGNAGETFVPYTTLARAADGGRMEERFAGGVLWLVVCLAAAVPGAAQDTPPTAAPATGVGTVSGTVLDKGTGEPVIDAGVEVVGQHRSTRTDLDGKYSLKLPPGTYEIRIFAGGFQAVRVQSVTVEAGRVAKADATLAAAGKAAGLVVEVTAQAKASNEATQLLKRQKAVEVRDTISAEQIKKSPGSDAKDVVVRAPAVTVKEGKYVVVRGLGDRYSGAVLNGSRLPSTDPERRVVGLDLFPAGFLDSLAIIKTYSPNLPGDFTGGLVDLDLRAAPDQLEGSFTSSIGGNTQATFQDFQTYQGSSWDVLGMGEGYRELPSGVPNLGTQSNGAPNTNAFDALPDRRRFSVTREFRDIWGVTEEAAPLNNGVNFNLGNRWGTFGAQFAGMYSNEYQQFDDGILRQAQPLTNGEKNAKSGAFFADNVERLSRWINRTGGLFTSEWQPSDRHRFDLRGLIDRNQYIYVDRLYGPNFNFGSGVYQLSHELHYTRDQLGYGQLTGADKFDLLDVNWRSALSQTKQNQPDTRFDVRSGTPPDLAYTTDSAGATRVYSTLNEWLTDSAVDLSRSFALPTTSAGLPWDMSVKVSTGPAYAFRDRHFAQRRFQYNNGLGAFDLTLPTETLLQPSNIGPDGFQLTEETKPRDIFDAHQQIVGEYGMLDFTLIPAKLFFTGGARVEQSQIQLNTATDVGVPFTKNLNTVDVLPAVNTRWAIRPDMNARVAWSQTVSRPEFRELSPVQYVAVRGKDIIQGNPFLTEAKIDNIDVRWEWFFSPLELVSAGFFHKSFTNQIELARLSNAATGTILSYGNFKSAELNGVELEGRKDLGTLWSPLRYWSVQTNFTYAHSNADRSSTNLYCGTRFNTAAGQAPPAYCVDGQLAGSGTGRPPVNSGQLFDQAPFIVNASLEYAHPRYGTARLLYYTADNTVTTVGITDAKTGLPTFTDRVLQRRDQLDAVLTIPLKEWVGTPLTAQLGAENLLNAPRVVTENFYDQQRNTAGVKFTFSLTYAF
jgi:outer membrane receptor protein involved in Fe transport